MRNIKLILEYDGTSYHGWQKQPEIPTVQNFLENSLFCLFQRKTKVIVAGRTDAGVHAKGQVVNFTTDASVPLSAIKPALNSYLPKDIRVKRVKEVSLDFHAQKSALSRLYRYIIHAGSFLSPFYRHFVWWIPFNLDPDKMRRASQFLIGEHDFSSFEGEGSPSLSSRRKIEKITLLKKRGFIIIYIRADSFLYKMARNIVGTLVEVGRGKIPASQIRAILKARDRRAAGPTASPQGLCLVRVRYGVDIVG